MWMGCPQARTAHGLGGPSPIGCTRKGIDGRGEMCLLGKGEVGEAEGRTLSTHGTKKESQRVLASSGLGRSPSAYCRLSAHEDSEALADMAHLRRERLECCVVGSHPLLNSPWPSAYRIGFDDCHLGSLIVAIAAAHRLFKGVVKIAEAPCVGPKLKRVEHSPFFFADVAHNIYLQRCTRLVA